MNAGQEREKKKSRSVWKYTTSPNTVRYIQTASVPTAVTSYKSSYCRHVRLEKHKYDSNINKAEHGYNIGMHAVDKHPVNNILRLNKVFL